MLQVENEQELKNSLSALDLSVPLRSKGRSKEQTERYTIAYLLSTLPSQRLSFPLTLEHRDRPDFFLKMGGCSIGIEHTEAVPQNEAHASFLREKGIGPDMHFVRRSVPGERKKRAKQLIKEIIADEPGDGWEGDSAEIEWADAIAYFAVEKIKKAKAKGFQKFDQNWLLIYDNWPLPHIDEIKAAEALSNLTSISDVMTDFDCIFVMNDSKLWEFSRRETRIYDIIVPNSNAIISDRPDDEGD